MADTNYSSVSQDPKTDEREFVYDDFLLDAKAEENDADEDEDEDAVEKDSVEKDAEFSEEDAEIESVAKEVLSFDNSVIDRAEEDRDVTTYQKTGDLKILDRIYRRRIPTLQAWAAKHFFPGLYLSEQDMASELSIVFIKAVEKYDPARKVAFNTCLYTFLLNRVKNMKNSIHAKKRICEEYEGPRSGMILSLDYSYNDKDGSDVTLRDLIAGNEPDGYEVKSFQDLIDGLSGGNDDIKDFLLRVSNGETVSSLIEEAKNGDISIKIDDEIKSIIEKNSSVKGAKRILKAKGLGAGVSSVVGMSVVGDSVVLSVTFKKTKKSTLLSKVIRNYKKNKKQYIDGIMR